MLYYIFNIKLKPSKIKIIYYVLQILKIYIFLFLIKFERLIIHLFGYSL
jgi:hypothetical protein